ncbi:hypothetical protein [Thermus sp.]|uniref:hypothetical protein n=1 Tax=Thermus sp. TaxID=275 RepID=UPI00260EF000|nr:hypothetical protein [Thermus sp.]MCX7850816.1 hypothetical protein [Thermus sp.]
MRVLFKKMGTTALHVTHDPEETMLLADRVGVMAEGRLLQVGSPEEVYEAPGSLAAFLALGRANLLPQDGEVLAFRQEWVREGGEVEALVLERRTLRGEVLCRVHLPWGRPGCASRPGPGNGWGWASPASCASPRDSVP